MIEFYNLVMFLMKHIFRWETYYAVRDNFFLVIIGLFIYPRTRAWMHSYVVKFFKTLTKANDDGTAYILANFLRDLGNTILKDKYCTASSYLYRDFIAYYKAYKALGGNGEIDILYNKVIHHVLDNQQRQGGFYEG